MKNHGFTLIELLVVIAVIGILASVVMASVNSSRIKARNAQRNTDIKQVINAFNLGLNGSNELPNAATNDWVCLSTSCYGDWSYIAANSTVDAFLAPYLPTKPTDPQGSARGMGGYIYYYNWPGDGSSAYDGTPIPPGSIIEWIQEPSNTPGVCGPGKVLIPTSTYVRCFFVLS